MTMPPDGHLGGALPPPPPPSSTPLPPPGWVLERGAPAPYVGLRRGSLATFWPRFGAAVLDGFIVNVPRVAISGTERGALLGIVLMVAYYVVAEGRYGATIGKRVVGLRVAGDDGRPIGLWRAFLRYLGRLVSTLPLLLGYFWMIWDRDRQTWHDKLAHSYVVQT